MHAPDDPQELQEVMLTYLRTLVEGIDALALELPQLPPVKRLCVKQQCAHAIQGMRACIAAVPGTPRGGAQDMQTLRACMRALLALCAQEQAHE